MSFLLSDLGNILLRDEGVGVRLAERLWSAMKYPARWRCWTAAPPGWS